MLKTVLFDLDDTILDFKLSERIALKKTLTQLGIRSDDAVLERYSVINLQQWKRLERKELTREQVKVGRYKILFDEFGIEASPKLATAIYEKNLACGHYFIDGAPEMLKRLHRDFDLYIVSNGAKKVQEGRLSTAGISPYFKGIFISEAVGFEKPAGEFFDFCFAEIKSRGADYARENSIIIGDSLTSDMQGGINAGIRTLWYNPKKMENTSAVKPDFEAHSFDEIIRILYQLK